MVPFKSNIRSSPGLKTLRISGSEKKKENERK